jgi:3-oxoacyl-(acyl-carrier-protein) synthase
MGAVTSVGNTIEEFWKNLWAGKSGSGTNRTLIFKKYKE